MSTKEAGWKQERKKKGQRPVGCRFVSSGLRSTLFEQQCSQQCSGSSFNELKRWGDEGVWAGRCVRGEGEGSQLFSPLCPNYKTCEASLYNTELFTIEIFQSTVLSEKISESSDLGHLTE